MTQPALHEDHLRLAGGQALRTNAQAVASLQHALATLPRPWWATVNFTFPAADQVAHVLFRCEATVDGGLMDEAGLEVTQSFKESLALAMTQAGTLVVRQEMGVKVQRPNERGQLEWVPQDRLYGFELHSGDWFPVTEAKMRQAYAFDAQTGRALPAVAGRNFAVLRKPKPKA